MTSPGSSHLGRLRHRPDQQLLGSIRDSAQCTGQRHQQQQRREPEPCGRSDRGHGNRTRQVRDDRRTAARRGCRSPARPSRWPRCTAPSPTAATNPIRAALPVVTSTSHGIATIETRLPTADRTSAANSTTSPRRGVMTGDAVLRRACGGQPCPPWRCGSAAARPRSRCPPDVHISFKVSVTNSCRSVFTTGDRVTTKAWTASPTTGSGTPITAAARTAGWVARTSSIGRQKMAQLRRVVTIMSCTRSTRNRYPSSSTYPRSPVRSHPSTSVEAGQLRLAQIPRERELAPHPHLPGLPGRSTFPSSSRISTSTSPYGVPAEASRSGCSRVLGQPRLGR